MSRVGKLPVKIPDKVKVSVNGETVFVEGPKGKVQKSFASAVKVTVADKKVGAACFGAATIALALLHVRDAFVRCAGICHKAA